MTALRLRIAAPAVALAVVAALLPFGAAPASAAPVPAPSASATAPAPSATAAVPVPARSSAAPRPASAPTPTPAPTPASTLATPAGRLLAVELQDGPVLTLPAGDGVRDRARLRIRSGQAGAVDVLARRGTSSVTLRKAVPLTAAAGAFQRTLAVDLGDLGADGSPQGDWRLIVRRTADHPVRATTGLRVGSGRPTAVTLTPVQRTLYPYRDGVLDSLDAAVTAADETGAVLPLTGTLRIDAGSLHRTRALKAQVATIPVTGLRLGAATLTASVRGPAGTAERTTTVTLAPNQVGQMRLTPSADTVQPVADGLLDAVTLTTSGAATADSPAPVSGTLTVSNFLGAVKRWRVTSGAAATFTWDGRVKGAVVPGVYMATLTLRGPQGPPSVRTTALTVTKDHLPYRVRDLFGVADGDQQGLAVHDGLFYVATDVGAGSSRIDVYDAKGVRTRTIGPLPIGHGAELSFSTTTGLLYAANGGPTTATTIWALDTAATDPAALVKQTFDLSALGPNGMVGVDDAGGRLLVFAGTKDAYTLSAVGFDGVVQRTVPIAIAGTPQGLDVVGTELWVYTSQRGRNRLARYTVTDDAVIAASTGSSAFDLMNPGEGEGFAFTGTDGAIFVGAHGPNRIGVLEPVTDE